MPVASIVATSGSPSLLMFLLSSTFFRVLTSARAQRPTAQPAANRGSCGHAWCAGNQYCLRLALLLPEYARTLLPRSHAGLRLCVGYWSTGLLTCCPDRAGFARRLSIHGHLPASLAPGWHRQYRGLNLAGCRP